VLVSPRPALGKKRGLGRALSLYTKQCTADQTCGETGWGTQKSDRGEPHCWNAGRAVRVGPNRKEMSGVYKGVGVTLEEPHKNQQDGRGKKKKNKLRREENSRPKSESVRRS